MRHGRTGQAPALERDSQGRFLGRCFGRVEHEPRLGPLAARRLFGDPRGCSFRVEWRPEDRFTAPPPAPRRLEARIERLGEDVAVIVRGRVQVIAVEIRRPSPKGGWMPLWVCPICAGRTRYLYSLGSLRCRSCAGFRWATEGGWKRRIETCLRRHDLAVADLGRRLNLPPGPPQPPFRFRTHGWDARVSAEPRRQKGHHERHA